MTFSEAIKYRVHDRELRASTEEDFLLSLTRRFYIRGVDEFPQNFGLIAGRQPVRANSLLTRRNAFDKQRA